MKEFEIEHWPDYFGKHTLKRLLKGYVKGILVLSAIAVVLFVLGFFTRLGFFTWGFRAFVFVICISPLLPIISYLQRNKKVPSYGVNKEGFLLNERGWNNAFFGWDEIKDLKEFDHPEFGKELHFEFVSMTKAINKKGQDKFAQSLTREYQIEKQPKKISGQLVKGDVSAFIARFQEYYHAYKQANPISEFEAYELAQAYIKEHHLPIAVSSKNCSFIESLEGHKGSFYAFPVTEMEAYKVLVSTARKAVEGIQTPKEVQYPHLAENTLTHDEAIEIAKKYIGNKLPDVKIKRAYFYHTGIFEFPHPCWIVATQNLKATLDGTSQTDYVIDAKSKDVVTTLTA